MEKEQLKKIKYLNKSNPTNVDKRNNSNSVGCNNSSLTNISRDNNKLGV